MPFPGCNYKGGLTIKLKHEKGKTGSGAGGRGEIQKRLKQIADQSPFKLVLPPLSWSLPLTSDCPMLKKRFCGCAFRTGKTETVPLP